MAKVYLETYDLKRAALALERWTHDFPDDAKPYLWRVQIDSRTGSDPRAVEIDYREALRRDPSLSTARLGLAEELRKRTVMPRPRPSSRRILQSTPTMPPVISVRGEI